jgi:hypothetical protein
MPIRQAPVRRFLATSMSISLSKRDMIFWRSAGVIACLHDPSYQVCCSAAATLGFLRAEPVVEPLLACLSPRDCQFQSIVLTSLGYIGDSRAIGPCCTVSTRKCPPSRKRQPGHPRKYWRIQYPEMTSTTYAMTRRAPRDWDLRQSYCVDLLCQRKQGSWQP